jgi:hypothetical protein
VEIFSLHRIVNPSFRWAYLHTQDAALHNCYFSSILQKLVSLMSWSGMYLHAFSSWRDGKCSTISFDSLAMHINIQARSDWSPKHRTAHISSFQATLLPNLIIIRISVLNACLVLWHLVLWPEWLEIYVYMELKRNRLTPNCIWRKAVFFMEFLKVHVNKIQCKLPLQNLQNSKTTRHLISLKVHLQV